MADPRLQIELRIDTAPFTRASRRAVEALNEFMRSFRLISRSYRRQYNLQRAIDGAQRVRHNTEAARRRGGW